MPACPSDILLLSSPNRSIALASDCASMSRPFLVAWRDNGEDRSEARAALDHTLKHEPYTTAKWAQRDTRAITQSAIPAAIGEVGEHHDPGGLAGQRHRAE